MVIGISKKHLTFINLDNPAFLFLKIRKSEKDGVGALTLCAARCALAEQRCPFNWNLTPIKNR